MLLDYLSTWGFYCVIRFQHSHDSETYGDNVQFSLKIDNNNSKDSISILKCEFNIYICILKSHVEILGKSYCD